jgi:hypothetical protein
MPGTCNVIRCALAGDSAFFSGGKLVSGCTLFSGGKLVSVGKLFTGSCTRPQADSQNAETASTHVTPVRPNIGYLVNPPLSDHPLPIVRCHVQKPTMNTRADQAITTVARVRIPRT